MNFKRELVIFIFVFIIGSILGLTGLFEFWTTDKMNYFWPGAVVQAVAGMFFGMTGVIAGTLFPIVSDAATGVSLTKVLFLIPANFLQSFVPFLTKKIFKFNPCQFNRKTILCFIIGCAIVPHLLGGLVAASGYYFSHEITTAKECIAIILNWSKANTSAAIVFGLILLKFFAPALRECKLYDEVD